MILQFFSACFWRANFARERKPNCWSRCPCCAARHRGVLLRATLWVVQWKLIYIYICYICVISQRICFDCLTQSSHVKSTSFCGDDRNFDDFNHHFDWSTPLYQETHQFWWVNLPLTALAAAGWTWQTLQADEKLKHVEADFCQHSMGTRANKNGLIPTKPWDFRRSLAISWGFNDTWGCSRGDVMGITV